MSDACVQYSDETADLLARQLLDGATADTRIAVVSAPSAFVALKNMLVSFVLSLSLTGARTDGRPVGE